MKGWFPLLISLLVGTGIGFWLGQRGAARSPSWECKPLFYRHPMNPEITSPTPAKDEMGMDYVPVYPPGCEGTAAEPGVVAIDPTVVQQIGVRTARAERRTIGYGIKTVGRVTYDEEQIVRLHPKVEGWVEELYVSETESFVRRGQPLLSLYAPVLVATEQELLLARQNHEILKESPLGEIRESAERLLEAARERLRLFDVPEHQIRELEERGELFESLHVHAPESGMVLAVHVREGQHVTPTTPLYTLVDLSRVWIYADLYEEELPWVRLGDPATFETQALPGLKFRGRIDYLYPTVDPKSRTVRARLSFANPDLLLRPGMFGTVRIEGRPKEAVVVPREAVLYDGDRAYLLLALGQGRFRPREVEVGVSSRDWIEIRSGVSPGEEVVVSGQFLIDSESRLKAALHRLAPPPSEANHTPPAGPVGEELAPEQESHKRRDHRHRQEGGGRHGVGLGGRQRPEGPPPLEGEARQGGGHRD